MTVGYAAFQTNLNIKGTSSISSNWDIIISNIEKISYGGEAEEAKAPTGIGSLTADMEVNLYQKGDYIEYDVTVLNRGTIDAVLSNITPAEREYIDSNNEAIKISFSGVNINDKLLKGDTHNLKVRIEYNPEFTGTPKEGSVSLEIGLEYTQAEMAGVPTINPNLYVSSNGDDTKGNGSKSNPYLTLSKAYTEASDNSTIYIMDDITQTETLNLNEDKNITLTSYGTRHSIIRGDNLINYVIHQQAGTLNIENIIIDGNNIESKDPMIRIDSDAYIEIGTLITKATNNNQEVDEGSSAGAILIKNGTLIINGGEISYNKSYKRAGGIYNYDGLLIMNNGNICNNSTPGTFGQDCGGGISNEGTINIKGGNIFNNTADYGGGIHNSGVGTVNIEGGNIYNNKTRTGGGIQNYGTINMSGGKIYSNTSTTSGGGLDSGTGGYINMTGGIIENNTSGNGGGVAVAANVSTGKSTIILDGGIIRNNKATTHGGLAIYNSSSWVGTYIYKSGIVCGNTPTNTYETHAKCP